MDRTRLCSQFRRQVDDLVGRDVAPERASELIRHACECLPCARLWKGALARAEALQRFSESSLEAAGIRPPARGATADAVLARLAAGEGVRRATPPIRTRRAAGFVAAAAAAAVAVGWPLLGLSGSGSNVGPRPGAPEGEIAGARSTDAPPAWPGRSLRPISDSESAMRSASEGASVEAWPPVDAWRATLPGRPPAAGRGRASALEVDLTSGGFVPDPDGRTRF
jgi:hypothetical protein